MTVRPPHVTQAPVPRAGGVGSMIKGQLHYSVRGVPSRYDSVGILGVPLRGSADFATHVYAQPNDTPAPARAAEASITTTGLG